jgi:hypothetical protein
MAFLQDQIDSGNLDNIATAELARRVAAKHIAGLVGTGNVLFVDLVGGEPTIVGTASGSAEILSLLSDGELLSKSGGVLVSVQKAEDVILGLLNEGEALVKTGGVLASSALSATSDRIVDGAASLVIDGAGERITLVGARDVYERNSYRYAGRHGEQEITRALDYTNPSASVIGAGNQVCGNVFDIKTFLDEGPIAIGDPGYASRWATRSYFIEGYVWLHGQTSGQISRLKFEAVGLFANTGNDNNEPTVVLPGQLAWTSSLDNLTLVGNMSFILSVGPNPGRRLQVQVNNTSGENLGVTMGDIRAHISGTNIV